MLYVSVFNTSLHTMAMTKRRWWRQRVKENETEMECFFGKKENRLFTFSFSSDFFSPTKEKYFCVVWVSCDFVHWRNYDAAKLKPNTLHITLECNKHLSSFVIAKTRLCFCVLICRKLWLNAVCERVREIEMKDGIIPTEWIGWQKPASMRREVDRLKWQISHRFSFVVNVRRGRTGVCVRSHNWNIYFDSIEMFGCNL